MEHDTFARLCARAPHLAAAAFGAMLSTAGRLVPAAAPASTPRVGSLAVVDRWDGSRFVEVELTWNGAAYVERCENCGRDGRAGSIFCSDACEKSFQEM